MTTIQFLVSFHNSTPSVALAALAGSKWPHSFRKHEMRDQFERLTGQRRLEPAKLAQLRKRENGLFILWSGAKASPLPLP